MQKETQQIEWTVATDDISQWLEEIGNLWTHNVAVGWQFVDKLTEGIDEFAKRQHKTELYELAHNQTGQSVKRLKNLVSMARNPNSALARELGLEFAYAEAVLSLPYDEAEIYLLQAAEQSLPAAAIGAKIREAKELAALPPDVPDGGNEHDQHSINDAMHDDPPFANRGSVLYDDTDAEADALAGNESGYDWEPADTDAYTYTGDEFLAEFSRSTNRLRGQEFWSEQHTLREWLQLVERNTY